MNIFLRKYELENIDINQIDKDALGDALLTSVIKVKDELKRIDKQVHFIATTNYVPGMKAIDFCESIVYLSNTKAKLINLCRAFKTWYDNLSPKRQKYCVAYFVKRKNGQFKHATSDRINERIIRITPILTSSFRNHIIFNTNLKEEDLIKCPLIYNTYLVAYNQKLTNSRKRGRKKGDIEHDSSADEK